MSTDTHTQANRQTDRHTYTQHVGPLAKCHFICIIGVTPIYPFHSHTTTHTDTYTKRHAHIRPHTHTRTRTHPHDNCKLVSGGWDPFSVLARVYQTHNVCTCHVVFASDFVSPRLVVLPLFFTLTPSLSLSLSLCFHHLIIDNENRI